MKNVKRALIAAFAMICPLIVLPACGIVVQEMELNRRLAPLKEDGLDKMQAVQSSIITPMHIHMAWDLTTCIYFLAIAALLAFAIRRLPKSN